MPLFEVNWVETRRGSTLIDAESESQATEILAMMTESEFNKTVQREDFNASAIRV